MNTRPRIRLNATSLLLTSTALLTVAASPSAGLAASLKGPLVVAQAAAPDDQERARRGQPPAATPQAKPQPPAAAPQAKPQPPAAQPHVQAPPQQSAPAAPPAQSAQPQHAPTAPPPRAAEERRPGPAAQERREERGNDHRPGQPPRAPAAQQQQPQPPSAPSTAQQPTRQQPPAAAQERRDERHQQTPSTAQQPQQRTAPPTAQQPQQAPAAPTAQQPQQRPVPPTAQQPQHTPPAPTAQQPQQRTVPPTAQQPQQAPAAPTAQQPQPRTAPSTAQQPQQPPTAPTAQQPQQPPTAPTAQQPQQRTVPPTAQQPQQAPTAPTAQQPPQPGAPATAQQPNAQPAPAAQAPAAVAPPTQARDGREFIRRDGQGPTRGIADVRQERQEVREGNRTVIREPDRTIIREGDRTIIQHNEANRFAIDARNVHTERRGGYTETVIERGNGVRIITVTDDEGRLIRRMRRDQSGRDIIIINNSYGGRGAEMFVQLPPPVIRIPRERYIVEAERARPEEIYGVFMAPPVERIERAYTLDQVRYSAPLRDRMPRVDLDITFDLGSWQLSPEQVDRLAAIADGINRAIERNPREVFMVEGHTDAVGTDDDNLSLSDRRAESVAVALTEQFRVPAENLVTQGYGEQYLKVPSEGPERANRRVAVRRITPLIDQQAANTGR